MMNLPIRTAPPIKLIVEGLKPVLIFIHDTLGVSWGFSIVLLTICVRAAMAPLMVKQFKSMQAMVRVGPQLKELQAKYKDDKQRQQQEVMKFYSENKINPFASCLRWSPSCRSSSGSSTCCRATCAARSAARRRRHAGSSRAPAGRAFSSSRTSRTTPMARCSSS